MAIEITEFAEVSISVSPVGVSGGNFGILGFLTLFSDTATNPIAPAERARAYTSLASVAGDWPADSEVMKAATAFYSQTPTPTDFVVLMSYDTAQPAQLIGGGHEQLTDLVAITTGAFTITMDSVEYVTTGIDLSSATTLAEVGTLLDAAILLQGAVVDTTYGAYGFVLTSLTGVGSTNTLSFATGDVAEALGFASYQAVVSDGVDAETPVDSLAAVAVKGTDYVGLVTHKDMRDVLAGATGETTLEIASFCEADKKIFCNTSNDLSMLNSATSTDVASVLMTASLRYSLTTFSKNYNLYPSASVFGRAASVNFSAIGSTITLNLKTMPGITSEDLTPAEFGVLRSKNASAVVQIGKTVNAYTDSRMASGSWLDTTHGLMWLENRCEVDLFNLLFQSTTKIPYTQTGINITVAVLDRSLQAAVRNGLAGPGYLPDGTYLPEGYIIESVALADIPSGDKGNRIYKGLSFKMVGAGALHEVVVSGSFSE